MNIWLLAVSTSHYFKFNGHMVRWCISLFPLLHVHSIHPSVGQSVHPLLHRSISPSVPFFSILLFIYGQLVHQSLGLCSNPFFLSVHWSIDSYTPAFYPCLMPLISPCVTCYYGFIYGVVYCIWLFHISSYSTTTTLILFSRGLATL